MELYCNFDSLEFIDRIFDNIKLYNLKFEKFFIKSTDIKYW